MWGILQGLVPSGVHGTLAGCVHTQQRMWSGEGVAALGLLLSNNSFSYDLKSFHVDCSVICVGLWLGSVVGPMCPVSVPSP